MKPGFLDALRAASAGQAPTPQQAAPVEPGMSALHEQLLASVQAREGGHPTETLAGGLVRTVHRYPRTASSSSTSSVVRTAPVRKGTIEEALGEEALGEDVVRLQPKVDERAVPDWDAMPLQPYAVVSYPDRSEVEEREAQDRIQAHLDGLADGAKDWSEEPPLRRQDQVRAVARQAVLDVVQQQVEVEKALAREAAGVQALPLEEDNLEGPAEMQVIRETLGAEITEDFLPAAGGITYDLPEDLAQLPLFCYICGPAGVGKTWQAKAWAAYNPEGVILAATTGIAAVNLGEGTTINALLRFYNTESLRDAFTGGWLEAQFKKLRGAGLQRVVLDETSMLSGDQLTILCRAIDNVNADKHEEDHDLGLVLTGDFAQLPPVKEPFAFESAEWGRFASATYALTTIRRQADLKFIEALQAVRRGDAATALEVFGPLLEQTTHQTFEGTTILAKNEAVDKYNQLRLDKVKGAALTFDSSRWGKVRSEWGGPPKPPREWGVPEVLHLKEGALVMILANRNVAGKGEAPEYLYVNGDLGQIVGMEHGCATVVLQRTGEPVQVTPILRENVIPLEPGRRKQLRAEGHPERISQNGKQEVIGACSYMPLRLAYSTTVHKSQGLSLDQVQVNIRDHFFSQPSMLYVALSRARTLEGLRVVGTVEGFRARCTVAAKVQEWL